MGWAGRRRAEAAAATVLLALLAAGCTEARAPDCTGLRGGAPALQATLFLGREVAGRTPVSRAEWEEFAATVVTPRFPDGFTVLDGQGQWHNPATGALVREGSLVLLLAAAPGPETPRRLEEIAAEHGGAIAKGRGLARGLGFEDTNVAGKVSKAAFDRKLLMETSGPSSEVLKINESSKEGL